MVDQGLNDSAMDNSSLKNATVGAPRKSLRRTYHAIFTALIVLVIAELALSLVGRRIDDHVYEGQQRRHTSYLIADELRQSSDDLTRMARMSAATGDPVYEHYYQDIIAIRDGKKARPVGYDKIYWDLVLLLGRHTDSSGRTVSLDQLFAAVEISAEEQALLQLAKTNSDALVKREVTAMNAVKGLYPDAMGQFTLHSSPDPVRAMKLLTGSDYNKAKVRIMKPLRDFQVLLDQRTQRDVIRLKQRARFFAKMEIGVSAAMAFLGVIAWALLNRRIIEPIQELTRAAMNLGRQGFSRRVEVRNDDELGVLCRTLNHMSESIEQQLVARKSGEAKFRGLIEAAPDALVITDEDGTISLINSQTEKMFGYTREELIGSSVDALMSDPSELAIDVEARHKDGRTFPIDVNSSPIEAEDSGALVCRSIRDVSERKQAERVIARQLAFQEALLETLPYPMFVKNADAGFIGINGAYASAFGISRDQIVGKTVLELAYLPEEARRSFQEEDLEVIRTASRRSRELPIMFSDQQEHVVLYSVDGFRLPDGSPGGLIGLLVDITERKRAEEELHRSQCLVQAVMDNTNAIVYVKDAAGRYLMVNRQWGESFGMSTDEAAGHTDHELFAKETAEAFARTDDEVRLSRELLTTEEQAEIGGRRSHFISSKFPLLDDDGELYGTAGISTDITEFKRSQEQMMQQRRMFQAIIDNAGAFIYVKDPDGRYLFVNKNYEQLLGRPSAEIVGRNAVDLFPAEEAANYDQGDNEVRKTLKLQESEQHALMNGEMRYFLAHKFPLLDDDGKLFATAGVSSDFTEIKRTHEELARAKDEADSANEAKSTFLATMSHEIRTPMNAVINMTALALETDLNNKQRQYLSVVSSSARGLLALINDILDFSKIEAGRMDLEITSFDLRQLLEEVADSFRGRVLEKHIEFVLHTAPDVPAVLKGDSLRLRQILINLVGNAFKFTSEGEVVLRVEMIGDRLPDDDGEGGEAVLKVSVRDSGVGIPADQIGKLGESFTQADASTARKFGGTGLGLAICKRLIEMMGGALLIESVEGEGSTFSFTSRFGYAMTDQPAGRECTPGLASTKVLVVEDNATSRELLENLFKSFGMPCTLTASAEEGWEKLQQADFGLAVIDWVLPGADGIALAKQIRENELTANLPLIMISSFAGKEEEAEAARVGINVFVPKPITASMLFDGVLEALKVTGVTVAKKADSIAKDESEFAGKHLLLAEDNEANQFVAEEILTRAGFKMDIANNGREAVEMVKARDYDAVLMDMQMPEMDGLEATREIRNQLAGRPLTIIALTANAMQSDLEACRAAGMDDYVAKPIDRRLLFKVLRKWMSGKPPKPVEEPAAPDVDAPLPIDSDDEDSENQPAKPTDIEAAEPVINETVETPKGSATESENEIVEPVLESQPIPDAAEPAVEELVIPAVADELPEVPPADDPEPSSSSETEPQVVESASMDKPAPKSARKKRAKNKAENLQPDLFGNLDGLEDESGPIEVTLDDDGVPNLPGIDFRDAMNRLGLPVDSIQKMILRFSGSLAQTFKDLLGAIDSKDDEAARRHAHSIVGAAGNLSADGLRRHAKTLELALKFGQGGYQDTVAELEAEAARVIAGIQQFEALAGGPSKKEIAPTQTASPAQLRKLQTVFEELIAALGEGDLEGISQVAGKLKDLPLPDTISGDFDRLTELVDGFDYADAIELARSMQGRIE